MAYKISYAPKTDSDALIKENIALKKEILVLETANKQLLKDRDSYKFAYERYSSFFAIKFLKKIMGKES